jgi:hypothetical protein
MIWRRAKKAPLSISVVTFPIIGLYPVIAILLYTLKPNTLMIISAKYVYLTVNGLI